MNMRTYKQSRSQTSPPSADAACRLAPAAPSAIRHPRGIALVITLLMLSVITFLAVAFLVLTRSHRDSVTVSLDLATAKSMSQAALARAQSEIIARMMAHRDILNYDYMASHNFISQNGFVTGVANVNNVNYDFYSTTGAPMGPGVNPADWAQNIANLHYDPRPPVFIRTDPTFPVSDFRFWVDVGRNGRFETNGYLPVIQENGRPLPDSNGGFVTNFFNGEPEWIGVLQYPESPHSATNRFIGRYAFLVLPIGKTLDFNFIHNYNKSLINGGPPLNMPALAQQYNTPNVGYDGFLRDQGVGSWELNLAGLLWALNTNIYVNSINHDPYNYLPRTATPNTGNPFDDAYAFLRFRYAANYGSPYPLSLAYFFGGYTPNYSLDGIDEYATEAFFPTSSYPSTNAPWPGGYSTNHFYDIQDVYNPNKTSLGFLDRLQGSAMGRVNSYDRYTFQRLLASIGTGSEPELQTRVYDDVTTTNPAVQPPTRLRTKVNLNYDNSFQITNRLNTSPAILAPWPSSLALFTNAAESLLRSQNFLITNYDIYGVPASQVYIHFGLTNIPVYSSVNPSIRYTENLHRMLQLAANICDATRTNTVPPAGSLPYPSVFRPLFFAANYGGTNQALFIVGYAVVTNDAASRILSMLSPGGLKLPSDPSITTNDNVWGIPWVVGAVKGLPAFDRYVAGTSWMVTRKLLFARKSPIIVNGTSFGDPALTPATTNQFLIMSISNIFGMDAWNSYGANITLPVEVIATNFVSIVLTNNSAGNPVSFAATVSLWTNSPPINFWQGSESQSNPTMAGGMRAVLQTNITALAQAYFSESARKFFPVSADVNITGFDFSQLVSSNWAFQALDLAQSTWPVYNWSLSVTNLVMYALVNPNTGQAFDFVNLGPFGTNLNLASILLNGTVPSVTLTGGTGSSSTVPDNKYWDTNQVPGHLSTGVLNQITNGISHDPYFAAELNGQTTVTVGTNIATVTSNLYFSCSNDVVATVFTGVTNSLLVNDPLVHYTVGDLTAPSTVPATMILTDNNRYSPWATPNYTNYGANMTFKDPLIFKSDSWIFPTNKFPSIGWLGRVHRGTPWQTIFMKADPDPVSLTGVHQNQSDWIGTWVNTLDTYPTNDYALLDLFTATPNDNAARGLLSVNQMNSAPWYALFSGIAVNTNLSYPPAPPIGANMILDPTSIAPLLDGFVVRTTGVNGQPVSRFLAGITATRAAEPDQVFHSLGSVFKSPTLSIYSPFLPGPVGAFRDEEVEAIPQQVAGLLKLGQPRFVIYGYGQALKPKDIYFGSQAGLFNLCTNYQITGEFLTRTVCHVVGDPTAANVKIQVDSFNILPAD